MDRRELLRTVGAVAALSLLDRDVHAVWSRVIPGVRPAGGLSDAHLALVSAVADTLIPRTDTPGALDVHVPEFVDLVVTQSYGEAQRAAFLSALDMLESIARKKFGAPFAQLPPATRARAMAVFDPPRTVAVSIVGERAAHILERLVEVGRRTLHMPSAPEAYAPLKSLVLRGYFTSEVVQRDVLHEVIMPGSFDGNAPMTPVAARGGMHSG